MKNVVTVDVGYGTCTLVAPKKGSNGYLIKTFASTPAQMKTSVDLSDGVTDERDLVSLNVDGSWYEVGPDVQSSLSGRSMRILNTEGFVTSSRYKALMLGSLLMSGISEIDVLVLGLPVSVVQRKDELIKMAVGEHDLGHGRKINVKNVYVFEQPLGALLSYIRARSITENADVYRQLQNETILTLDPGYLTFDFLVSKGLKIDRQLSDDVECGMSKVLSAVEVSLREQLTQTDLGAVKAISTESLDQGFVTGKIKLFGREMLFPISNSPKYDVTDAVRAVTNEAVQAVVNVVGDGQRIDRIIVSGGPANVYLPSIKQAFPNHRIDIIPSSLTAVARGLQTAGEQYLRQQEVMAANASQTEAAL